MDITRYYSPLIILVVFLLLQVDTLPDSTCNEPLGIQNGHIKDYQMFAYKAYDGDTSKYGAHNARLMKTSKPQGYRGDKSAPGDSWLTITFEKKRVVTAIATQGYGDPSVKEWVTKFVVLYTNGGDFQPFIDDSNSITIFIGNNDSSTVHRQSFPFPVLASQIIVMPNSWNNNVGIRMELYGCEPDFYMTAFLLLSDQLFTTKFQDNQSYNYRMVMEESLAEAKTYWRTVPGYLDITFKGFSPQQDVLPQTLTAVEFDVYCLESRLADMLKKMKTFIKDSDLFDSNFYRLRYPRTNVHCYPPTLDIISDLTKSSKNVSVLRGSSPSFKIETKYNCSTKPVIYTSCRFAAIDPKNGRLTSFVPISSPNKRQVNQVTLRPNAYINSHLIYLQCQADNRGFEGVFVQDYKVIRVFEAKLVPKIKGSRYAIKGGNSLMLDGSRSYLQIKGEYPEVIHMDFSWYCHIRDNRDMKTESKSSDGIEIKARGCLNGSVEEPITTNKTLIIDNNRLVGGGIYVFKLIIAANGLVSSVKHQVTVEKQTVLSLSCLSNCLTKINPQSKQVFGSNCNGGACLKLKTYQWTFYLFDKDSMKHQQQNVTGTATSLSEDGHTFIINNFKELIGSLSNEDQNYKVKLTAYLDTYTYVSAETYFILNAVPKIADGKSGCIVSPTVGTAMETSFNVSCANWQDADVPLSYQFMYYSEFGMILLKTGSNSQISTKFLPGNKMFNFIVNIIIIITDVYGVSSKVTLHAKVLLPTKRKADSVIHNADSKLSTLLEAGNSDEAADQSLFVLSLLQTFNKNPETDIKAKDDILKQMSQAEIISTPQVSKSGSIAKTATKQERKMTLKSQSNALKLIEKASRVIASNVARKSSNLSLAMVELFSDSLVEGVSNVLHSSLKSAAKTDTKTLNNTDDEEVKITQRSTKVIKSVANSLTSITTIGDGPKVLRTTNVVVQVEKNIPSSFNKRVIREEEKVVIILPTLQDLFSNMNYTPTLISCQMLEYPVNPYYWDASSKAINSAVADISLHVDNRELKIPSLRNPISLVLKKNAPEHFVTRPSDPNYTTKKENAQYMGAANHAKSINPSFFLKPPTNGSDNIRYHRLFLPSPYMTATVRLIPEKGKEIEVFVSPMRRPSPSNFSYATRIPDLSSCTDKDITSFKLENCTGDVYTIEITRNITGMTGLHFVGLRLALHEPNKSHTVNTSKDIRRKNRRTIPQWLLHPLNHNLGNKQKNSRSPRLPLLKNLQGDYRGISRREDFEKRRRKRRSCIKVKDPPPTPSTYVPDVKVYNPETDVTYQFSSSVSACMFWSEVEQQWKSDGCKLGTKSNSTHIHCLCYHMTAFGGDFFVAPNPIDFDKILFEFTRLGVSNNYVVLSIVLIVWLLYIIGLVFARKADLNDKHKIVSCSVIPSEEATGNDLKTYRISIQTASWIGSGTTASVGMTIYSDDAKNLVSLHFNNTDPDKKLFSRGSVNTYFVRLHETLTNIFKLTIWHDNAGSNPSWFLQDVMISEEDGSRQWSFLANRWLAVDKEDHCISADFFVTEENELKKFKNRLYARAAKQFTNAHLWLSLFTKSVHSPFTRCQRLSCCLLILMATMVSNAMFYQFGAKSSDIIFIGPLQVSLKGVITGIQSSLIVLPISVLTVLIFDNVKQKQASAVCDENEPILVEEKMKGCVPWPFVLVAWFLCISGAAVSSVFTVFYSLMWGADTANQWLASIMVSFLQDIFLTQPVKIIVLMSLLAFIIKKPINNHDDVIISKNQQLRVQEPVQIPSEEKVTEARIFAESKTASKHFLTELGIYLPFIVLLFIVCYGNRDSKRFQLTNSLWNIAPNFDQVTEPPSYWKWVKQEPLSALYEITWYNNQKFKDANGFNSNKKIFLVGMPRLRQVRVKGQTCPKVELHHLFKRCLPTYSISREDDTPYSLPGWKEAHFGNFSDQTTTSNLDRLCPRPWRYMDSKQIQTLPFYGTGILYGGGGFVADLGYNESTAYAVVDLLRENNWIDEYTAAVFLEFTVFNPSSALFSSVRYLYERFPSGSFNTVTRIDSLIVYTPTNKSAYFVFQLCQFLLMVIIVVTMVFEMIKIIKQGLPYFRVIWNLLQWIEAISIVIAVTMFNLKEKNVGRFITRLQANPYQTSSTDYIIMWSDLETFVLSLVIFVVTVKLLRLIRFSKSVYQLHRTIFQSIKMLRSIFLVFLVNMTAITFMATIAFGNLSHSFSSFIKAFGKLICPLAGGKIFQKDSSFSETSLGLLFGIVYTVLNTFLLVNLLLSVIIDSFAASKSSTDPKAIENSKMSEFTKKYIRNAFSRQRKKLSRLINRKSTKNKYYKTKKRSDEKYIYQDIESSGYDDFQDMGLRNTAYQGNGIQNRLMKLYYNNEILEKLSFDAVPLKTTEDDKSYEDNEGCSSGVDAAKKTKHLRFEFMPHDEKPEAVFADEEKDGDGYNDDEDPLDEVKGSLTEIIDILKSITCEKKA